MSYEVKTMKEALFGNPYVGRGIVIGKSEDGKKAVFAYSSWAGAKTAATACSSNRAKKSPSIPMTRAR